MRKLLELSRVNNINYYGTKTIEIELEDYVAIATSSEIGNAPLEACKAQAVAIRTNALGRAVLTDDSRVFQAFVASKRYQNAIAAAKATAGQILRYKGKPALPAAFSSCNAGRTVSSKERWGGERAFLIAKDDPYNQMKSPKGHGVGMSQTGAMEMARQGMDYRAILAFYYPGTELEGVEDSKEGGEGLAEDKIEKLRNWCKSKVGCGYVWGASGQVLTAVVLAELKAKFPKYINTGIVSKWMGKPVYDCANFVAQAFNRIGFRPHTGASSQWNNGKWADKGEIGTLPKDRVCILFRTSPKAKPMQHTGIYLGDGTVIDARGSNSGVLHTRLEAYKWSHWGLLEGLYKDGTGGKPGLPIKVEKEVIEVLYTARVKARTGDTVRLRESPSTLSKILQAVRIHTTVEVLQEQGDWSRIRANGQEGWMMREFLQRLAGGEGTTKALWRVVIDCESEEDAKKTAELFAKARAEKATT